MRYPVKHLRALIEEVKRLRANVALLRPALAQLEEAFEEESDAHDALKAEVARLRARPAPAWDEEAVAEAFARALWAHGAGEAAYLVADLAQMWDEGTLPQDPETQRSVRVIRAQTAAALAVIRDHLPVKPDREAVARALDPGAWSDPITGKSVWGATPEAVRQTRRHSALVQADAVLDLWPGCSEAEVRADARTAAYREWFVKHAEVSSGYYLIPCVDCAGTGVFPVPAGYEGDSSCVRCKATGAVPLSAVDPKIDDTWAEIKTRWQAEALREWVEDVTGDLAATEAEGIGLGSDYLHGMRSALMQATERADRLAAEGGADRG